jgi:polyene macrolide polyketide synthase
MSPSPEAGIRKWITGWNRDPEPFAWTMTADEILENLAACCRRVNGSAS